jgi:hypothetical protein
MSETKNPPEAAKSTSGTRTAKPIRRSRGAGTATIAGHFPEAVRRQLRIIAAQEGRTNQSLIGEALNDLFRKRGQLPIAPE